VECNKQPSQEGEMVVKIDEAELLDIIAGFQEGFNTNLHCLELVRCIADNADTWVGTEYIKHLDDLIKVQKDSLTDEYMRGLANGLICAKAVFTDKEPDYIDERRNGDE